MGHLIALVLISSFNVFALDCGQNNTNIEQLICADKSLKVLIDQRDFLKNVRAEALPVKARKKLIDSEGKWRSDIEQCLLRTNSKIKPCISLQLRVQIEGIKKLDTPQAGDKSFDAAGVKIICADDSMSLIRTHQMYAQKDESVIDLGQLYSVEKKEITIGDKTANEEIWISKGAIKKACKVGQKNIEVIVDIGPGYYKPRGKCGMVLDYSFAISMNSNILMKRTWARGDCHQNNGQVLHTVSIKPDSDQIVFVASNEENFYLRDDQRTQVLPISSLLKKSFQSLSLFPISKKPNYLKDRYEEKNFKTNPSRLEN